MNDNMRKPCSGYKQPKRECRKCGKVKTIQRDGMCKPCCGYKRGTLFDARTHARTTDAMTSHAAAGRASHSETVRLHYSRALRAVHDAGTLGVTVHGVAARTGIDAEKLTKRMTDLCRDGHVYADGVRRVPYASTKVCTVYKHAAFHPCGSDPLPISYRRTASGALGAARQPNVCHACGAPQRRR